jgi:hypothetical protein
MCIYGGMNPHYHEEIQQHSPHVIICTGVTAEGIIDPYLLQDGGITGEKCLNIL